jgi:hypothetical protein
MRAMICRQWGAPEDLRLEEVEPAPLKAGQVRIKIRAAGVSFATTLVIAGKYQRRLPLPFAPGTEASGVVTEVDPACKRLKVGDEVVAVLDWEMCTVATTVYANGFIGVQPVPLGDGGSMQPIEAHSLPGFISRPRDPDAVNGVPTSAANVLVGWEGSRGHAIMLGDPRVMPKLPQVKKGGLFGLFKGR